MDRQYRFAKLPRIGNRLICIIPARGSRVINSQHHIRLADNCTVCFKLCIRLFMETTDVSMIVSFLRQFQSVRGVKYLRVGRKESYPVYPADYDFQIGKGAVLRTGSDAVIVASGIMVHEALQAAEELERAGISAAVIDPVTVKPLDEALIRSWAKKTGIVVTAENHNRIGGLTSAVQAAVCGMPLRFGVVAVEDCFGEVGPQSYLQERFGLTAGHIVQTTKAALDLPRRQ